MDYLWTPWRYRYVSQGAPEQRTNEPDCLFCSVLEQKNDEETLILQRATHNFVILNRYPYTNGHLMIAPFAHGGDLSKLPAATLAEMMTLAQQAQRALAATYKPDGYNLGMNLGRVAGAGVAEHVHLHVLPRWSGDTSFMTTVGETRVEPEEVATTYRRLKPLLAQ